MALSPWRTIRAEPRWRSTQVVSSEVSWAERMSASQVRGQRRAPWGVGSRGRTWAGAAGYGREGEVLSLRDRVTGGNAPEVPAGPVPGFQLLQPPLPLSRLLPCRKRQNDHGCTCLRNEWELITYFAEPKTLFPYGANDPQKNV